MCTGAVGRDGKFKGLLWNCGRRESEPLTGRVARPGTNTAVLYRRGTYFKQFFFFRPSRLVEVWQLTFMILMVS